MAHNAQINVNGVLTTVTEFDNPAQAIDDAVTVLGAPTTPQAALAALGAGVRPNLLDNAYFVGGGSQQGGGQFPINQRGQTSYTGGVGFMDRWKGNGVYASAEINSDGVTFSGSGGTGYTNQVVKDSQSLYGKTVTISALTEDFGLLSATGVALSDPVTQNTQILNCSFSTGQSFSLYKQSDGNFFFAIRNTIGYSTKYIAAKLEEGPNQTLAYQDSTGAWHRLPQPEDGDYAGQLAKCQAYQVVINTLDVSGATNNTTTLYANIPTPVTMRAIPAIENNGVFNVRGGGINQANLTAAIYSTSLNANGIRVGIAGQFKVNELYQVTITSPIILNANL